MLDSKIDIYKINEPIFMIRYDIINISNNRDAQCGEKVASKHDESCFLLQVERWCNQKKQPLLFHEY